MLALTPTQARRLAITKQRLADPQPKPSTRGILDVFRDLGCIQIDPIRAVERTQYLVLWSRLGKYALSDLDRLVFEDKQLFEYWAHAASIVLIKNYPIHRYQAQRFAKAMDGQGVSAWEKRLGKWFQANEAFHHYVLEEMDQQGPRALSDLEDRSTKNWESSGWTSNRRLAMMIQMMWERGEIMVVERQGSKKKWDLAERWLPDWTPSEVLAAEEVSYRSVQIALRALGAGTEKHIRNHFTRGFYPELESALNRLLAEGRILSVDIADWPEQWYMHADDIPLLEQITDANWQPRTTLLSPFDNLICDRDRTELMWDFRFRIEIYVPKAKRKYGYYVLPILHSDRLIGRIDPKLDRKTGILHINAVHIEPDAPGDTETGQAVAATIVDLAEWLGAQQIAYGERLPKTWRRSFSDFHTT
ncbi:MAG: winged helix-turn-helix domain-containing protein [Chloroflexi bacterium]|nr:winged helix-turn-helix domain-containing protein [Chloroflexota bacterium]